MALLLVPSPIVKPAVGLVVPMPTLAPVISKKLFESSKATNGPAAWPIVAPSVIVADVVIVGVVKFQSVTATLSSIVGEAQVLPSSPPGVSDELYTSLPPSVIVVASRVPSTSKLYPGAVVPIPTLPCINIPF